MAHSVRGKRDRRRVGRVREARRRAMFRRWSAMVIMLGGAS